MSSRTRQLSHASTCEFHSSSAYRYPPRRRSNLRASGISSRARVACRHHSTRARVWLGLQVWKRNDDKLQSSNIVTLNKSRCHFYHGTREREGEGPGGFLRGRRQKPSSHVICNAFLKRVGSCSVIRRLGHRVALTFAYGMRRLFMACGQMCGRAVAGTSPPIQL